MPHHLFHCSGKKTFRPSLFQKKEIVSPLLFFLSSRDLCCHCRSRSRGLRLYRSCRALSPARASPRSPSPSPSLLLSQSGGAPAFPVGAPPPAHGLGGGACHYADGSGGACLPARRDAFPTANASLLLSLNLLEP